MSHSYVAMSFRSLPREIKKAIAENIELSEFEVLIRRLKFSPASRIAGLHHYKKMNRTTLSLQAQKAP